MTQYHRVVRSEKRDAVLANDIALPAADAMNATWFRPGTGSGFQFKDIIEPDLPCAGNGLGQQ